jgi:para-nitrobenzyl esterase
MAAVIMHSGSGNAIPRAQADRGGSELARRLGCDRAAASDTLACLRAAAPEAIASALPESLAPGGVRFGPVIDGWLLPARPIELVARGDHNHVPLVVSTTTREFSTMVQGYLDGPLATTADYEAMVARRFPLVAPRLLELYPASAYATPRDALIALMSDENFVCPSDWLADAAAAHQREPVYRFLFDHAYGGAIAPLGAGHGLDLHMIFRNLPPAVQLDDAERALSDQLIAAWSQLAHTGALPWPTRVRGAAEQLDHALHPATSDVARCTALRELMRR